MLLPFSAIPGIPEVSIPYVFPDLSTGSKTKSCETGNVTNQDSSQSDSESVESQTNSVYFIP